MWGLFLFDSTKYPFKEFQPLLDKINVSNHYFFEQLLIGRWRFSHDFGTGLVTQVTTTTAVDTCNTVNFDGSEASFFFNDSLLRKTGYILKPRENTFDFTKYNRFDIYLFDEKQTWGFTVTNNEQKETTLTVELNPLCSCGCRLDIYRKMK